MVTLVNYRPLASQITRANLLIISASLLAVLILTNVMIWYLTLERVMASADLAAQQLARQIEVMLVFEDEPNAQRELRNFAEFRPVEQLYLLKANKELFTLWPTASKDDPQQQIAHKNYFQKLKRQGSALWISQPVTNQQEVIGYLLIKENLSQELNWLLQLSFLQTSIILLVILAAGFWFKKTHYNAFKPLSALSQLAEQVSTHRDFSLRANIQQHDDIGKLATHFNELLKRLQLWQHEQEQQLAYQESIGQQLNTLAHSDSLTKLRNRLGFNQDLKESITIASQSQQCVALLFIDLDQFKYVNDNFGHQAGDHVLQIFAERLLLAIRADDKAYRLAGDEFAVLLLATTDIETTAQIAQRIITRWQEPVIYNDQLMPVGCSIGIALYPEHADSAITLLEKADMAMYQAKRSGRGHYVVYQTGK